MIVFHNELPMDHEPSLLYIADSRANEDIENGDRLCWDSAIETTWNELEYELEVEELDYSYRGDTMCIYRTEEGYAYSKIVLNGGNKNER